METLSQTRPRDRQVRRSVRVCCVTCGGNVADGALKVGKLYFTGPVPDEGDYPAELEGTWRIDGVD